MKEALENYIGRQVVLDTGSSWVYLGTLEQVDDRTAVLVDADAHDNRDVPASKDLYVFESRKTGIKANRIRVYISLDQVVSFSLLEDVKEF